MTEKNMKDDFDIRIVKLSHNAVVELVTALFNEQERQRLCLSNAKIAQRHIAVEHFFSEETCECILLAHKKTNRIDIEQLRTSIQESSIEHTNSFWTNSEKSVIFESLYNSQPMNHHTAHRSFCERIFDEWSKIEPVWNKNIHPLKDDEVRVIRLSQKGIEELIWEYFVAHGMQLMGLKNKCDEIMFYMKTIGFLNAIYLCAFPMSQYSPELDSQLDNYIEKNLPFTNLTWNKKSCPEIQYHSIRKSDLN